MPGSLAEVEVQFQDEQRAGASLQRVDVVQPRAFVATQYRIPDLHWHVFCTLAGVVISCFGGKNEERTIERAVVSSARD